MGSSQSINTLDTAINNSINILNDSYQDCFTQQSAQQVIVSTGCSSTVIENVGSNNVFTISRSCQQAANANNAVQQQVVAELQQAATSIAQSLGIQGTTRAENILNLSTNLGITISNTYTQSCSLNLNASQTINVNCNNVAPGIVTIRNIGIDTATEYVGNCTQTSDTVNQIRQSLVVEIQQAATAKVTDVLGPLLFIIAIVILFFIFFFFGGFVGIFFSPTFWIILFIIFIVYIILAYIYQFWPF